jgi:hypothetical protein
MKVSIKAKKKRALNSIYLNWHGNCVGIYSFKNKMID